MGTHSKTARSIRRKAEKTARKAVLQRQYEQWAAEGRNSKSKRARARTKKENRIGIRTSDPHAKNIGDVSRFPEFNLPFLVRMHLLERDEGYSNQWSGKNRTKVKEFCETLDLSSVNGKIYSRNKPVDDTFIQETAYLF